MARDVTTFAAHGQEQHAADVQQYATAWEIGHRRIESQARELRAHGEQLARQYEVARDALRTYQNGLLRYQREALARQERVAAVLDDYEARLEARQPGDPPVAEPEIELPVLYVPASREDIADLLVSPPSPSAALLVTRCLGHGERRRRHYADAAVQTGVPPGAKPRAPRKK